MRRPGRKTETPRRGTDEARAYRTRIVRIESVATRACNDDNLELGGSPCDENEPVDKSRAMNKLKVTTPSKGNRLGPWATRTRER